MKHRVLFLLCMLCVFASQSFFTACSESDLSKVEYSKMEEKEVLTDFMDKHSALMEKFFAQHSFVKTKGVESGNLDYLYDAIKQNVEQVVQFLSLA